MVRAVDDTDPLDIAVRLLVGREALPADAVTAALGSLDPWLESGVLTSDGGMVTAPMRIVPEQGLLVRSDHEVKGEVRADHVAGVAAATGVVRAAVPAFDGPLRALDLGCGPGWLAMSLAAAGATVLATDVSERAVAAAADSIALSGIDGVEVRVGDGYAPAAGERFDLVVANPPFVVSPTSTYVYRDGTERGDAFCRRVLRAAPDHLVEGGLLVLVVSWPHHRGRAWEDELRAWFDGLPLDAWVVRNDTRSAVSYAAQWIGQTEELDASAYRGEVARWVAAYDDEQIDQLSIGVVVARRRPDGLPPRVVVVPPPDRFTEGAGTQALDVLDALDLLEDDDALRHAGLRRVPRLRLRHELGPAVAEPGWAPVAAVLDHAGGAAWPGPIDPEGIAVLAALDRAPTVDAALAEVLGPDRAATPDALEPLRGLLRLGYLRVV